MPTMSGLATIAFLAVADQKKSHNDVFTSGPPNETQLARQIPHELLMLPYYSIFDDLAFQLNGSMVTLEGACPPDPPRISGLMLKTR